MMTSWAIVCDVWYLPPMTKKPEEDAITFANRVKAEIARQGGLVDLMWYVLVIKLEMNNHLFRYLLKVLLIYSLLFLFLQGRKSQKKSSQIRVEGQTTTGLCRTNQN